MKLSKRNIKNRIGGNLQHRDVTRSEPRVGMLVKATKPSHYSTFADGGGNWSFLPGEVFEIIDEVSHDTVGMAYEYTLKGVDGGIKKTSRGHIKSYFTLVTTRSGVSGALSQHASYDVLNTLAVSIKKQIGMQEHHLSSDIVYKWNEISGALSTAAHMGAYANNARERYVDGVLASTEREILQPGGLKSILQEILVASDSEGNSELSERLRNIMSDARLQPPTRRTTRAAFATGDVLRVTTPFVSDRNVTKHFNYPNLLPGYTFHAGEIVRVVEVNMNEIIGELENGAYVYIPNRDLSNLGAV